VYINIEVFRGLCYIDLNILQKGAGKMKKLKFPDGFVWGAATASYQIEGAAFEDGRGESIWDRFSHTPGKISDGTNGDIGCDHYHLYEQDIALMKELGLQAYRLSISWTRIFPDGAGAPNQKGIEFYKSLLKLLRENEIKTAVTLYHWDLPQKLQDNGGWTNRNTADCFEEYARYLFGQFDGLVDWWITHNEPFCAAFLGHWHGRHAPGIQDFSAALLASHHLLLSHGKAVRAFREMKTGGEIGIVLNMDGYYPATESEADKRAAELSHEAWSLWFSDPIFGKGYPKSVWERYEGRVVLPDVHDGDLEIISSPIDFLGLNNYFSGQCTACEDAWPLGVKKDFIGEDRTSMGWGINPEGFYDVITRMHKRYGGIKIYITENGCAFNDIVDVHGNVEDPNRIDYFTRYLTALHQAIENGANVKGYFAWSLMDNFEWSFGFSKRFGLIYVDYNTKKRIIKKSGHWYRDVIRGNGF
jgi:beta-glucosidase